jgi:hypothetical protein
VVEQVESRVASSSIYEADPQRDVSELLAYNFKQFGGLIRIVPLVFGSATCMLRDLGQLVARAHYWLSGLRGKQKARQTALQNRFMETFFRNWYQNSRGPSIVAATNLRADAQRECDFFVMQVAELLRIGRNSDSTADSVTAEVPLYLVSVLADLRTSGLHVNAEKLELAGDDRENANYGMPS